MVDDAGGTLLARTGEAVPQTGRNQESSITAFKVKVTCLDGSVGVMDLEQCEDQHRGEREFDVAHQCYYHSNLIISRSRRYVLERKYEYGIFSMQQGCVKLKTTYNEITINEAATWFLDKCIDQDKCEIPFEVAHYLDRFDIDGVGGVAPSTEQFERARAEHNIETKPATAEEPVESPTGTISAGVEAGPDCGQCEGTQQTGREVVTSEPPADPQKTFTSRQLVFLADGQSVIFEGHKYSITDDTAYRALRTIAESKRKLTLKNIGMGRADRSIKKWLPEGLRSCITVKTGRSGGFLLVPGVVARFEDIGRP
jgi:hypothetical protein